MLKMRPQYAAAELAHIGDNKRRPELRPRDKLGRLRVVDHLIKLGHEIVGGQWFTKDVHGTDHDTHPKRVLHATVYQQKSTP